MSWASRRQFSYLSIVIIFVVGIMFLILRPILFKTPTCTDNKKNGTELGVDCGGICQKFCPFQVSNPSVLWARAFLVSGNSYNLLAYVENQNQNGAVYSGNYEFRIYDVENKLIGRREGSTFIPPNQRFAVFEARFNTGQKVPKNVIFSFEENMDWWKKESIMQTLPIKVDRILLGDDSTAPSLTARVRNESIVDVPEFDAIAILYDANKNAIGVSKTRGNNLKSNTESILLFTWLNSFSDTPVTKDVFLQINPFLFAD